MSYEIANAASIDNFQVPKFKDWLVVSGPMNSTSQSIINGQSSQSTSITYFLQPKHTGRLIVEGASAVINGKTVSSSNKSVEVLNKNIDDVQGNGVSNTDPFGNLFDDPFAAQSPPVPQPPPVENFRDAIVLEPNESAPEKIRKNLFIRVNTSKSTCYEGEAIMATYKLYSRLDLTKLAIVRRPSFSGFSAYDLEQPDQPYTIEKVDGKDYKCWVIRKVQLYPLQPGQLTLESAEIDCEIQFAKGEMVANGTYDPYNSNSFIRTSYSLKSAPVTVTAQALPTEGKPQNFKGAVGSFRIASAVDDNNPGKGDAIHLGVRISGTGNFAMVPAPLVSWPANTEAYDPKEIENLDKTAMPIAGDKLFDYTFLAHQPGQLTIPAISFSYFDIDSKTYKTISSVPIQLTIGAVSKRPVSAVNTSTQNWPIVFSRIAAVLLPILAVVLLIVLVLSFTKRKKKQQKSDQEKRENNLAWEKLLQEVEQKKKGVDQESYQPATLVNTGLVEHENYMPAGFVEQSLPTINSDGVARETKPVNLVQSETLIWQDDHRLFYKALKSDILSALENIAGKSGNKDELVQTVIGRGADVEVGQQINSLIEECDAALYSPMSNATDRQNMLEEAKFLLGKL